MQKSSLRQQYKYYASQLSSDYIAEKSAIIENNLQSYIRNLLENCYTQEKSNTKLSVALYIAMPGEPHLNRLIADMQQNHKITLLLPGIEEYYSFSERHYREIFVRCDEKSVFHKNSWNFWQPTANDAVLFALNSPKVAERQSLCPDIMVMPCLAFDRLGHRLGRGKGFFDRITQRCRRERAELDSRPVHSIITAFSGQEYAPYLPREAHDLRASTIITEAGVRRINSG